MERRKLESAALFLTIFGAMLIMPPLVLLFNATTRVFGVPTEVIYLFVVWLALIVATRWFSQRLPQEVPADEKPEEQG
ncbi:MAG TPA: hypothetical protein VGN80_06975 [Devosiaceae bacterium]|jgi:uncharacterized membrane protein YccC|nr:hypothetical protein [Devosiaceae bacterium]